MIQNTQSCRRAFALTGLLAVIGSTGLTSVGMAQATKTKKNVFQRHRHLTSAAAGVAAYKAAKHTGKNRTASGKKKNFAQRHPYMTGGAAAVGANHLLKKKK